MSNDRENPPVHIYKRKTQSTVRLQSITMGSESNDLHGMAPDTHDMALILIDVINHLDFEGNEGLVH